jgi:hypothetical protein
MGGKKGGQKMANDQKPIENMLTREQVEKRSLAATIAASVAGGIAGGAAGVATTQALNKLTGADKSKDQPKKG